MQSSVPHEPLCAWQCQRCCHRERYCSQCVFLTKLCILRFSNQPTSLLSSLSLPDACINHYFTASQNILLCHVFLLPLQIPYIRARSPSLRCPTSPAHNSKRYSCESSASLSKDDYANIVSAPLQTIAYRHPPSSPPAPPPPSFPTSCKTTSVVG